MTAPRHVDVASLPVVDLPRAELVAALAGAVPTDRAFTAVDLHVGALLARDRRLFVAAVTDADIAFADGTAIVLLAWLAGARAIERSPVTDIGHDILGALAARLQRAPRTALIGGPPGLADHAGDVLVRRHGVEVVLAEHGYHDDWDAPLARLRVTRPDVVFVGLGVPLEAEWVAAHRDGLPAALVVTCGGWFGHLTGAERRAPERAQRLGLEWVWRVAQDPRRLVGRYARGAAATASVAAGLIVARVRGRG